MLLSYTFTNNNTFQYLSILTMFLSTLYIFMLATFYELFLI